MKTKVAEFKKDPVGFIEIRFFQTTEVFDLAEAKLQFETVVELTNGKPCKVLVDMTDTNCSPTKDAQSYILSTEIKIAEAILVESLAFKILARFYVKKSKQNPTRIFTSRKKAIEWLSSF